MTEIRTALAADAPFIHQIAEATWFNAYEPIIGREQVQYMLDAMYDTEVLAQQISNNEQTYLLLFENNTPVAFASYAPRKENQVVYKLHKLYCLEETRGKGYGRMLVNAVEDAVKQNNSNILELNVNRYNPAKNFYEKIGFTVVYEEDIPIGTYWMNDYVMRKELL